jgi:hypothetical protein
MKIINSVVIAAAFAVASPAFAQTAAPTTIDCDDAANAEEEVCLALPPSTATNFAPVVAGVGGLVALGALSGGGGSTSTTTTSTGTP